MGVFIYNKVLFLFSVSHHHLHNRYAGFTSLHCLQLVLFRPLHPVSLELPTLATALLLFLACGGAFDEDDHLPIIFTLPSHDPNNVGLVCTT